MQRYALLVLLALASITTWGQDKTPTITDKTKNSKAYAGYFNFYWDEKEGKFGSKSTSGIRKFSTSMAFPLE